MITKLDFLPGAIPTTYSAGQALRGNPAYLLNRIADASGTIAGRVCRTLWSEFGTAGSHLDVRRSILANDPLDTEGCCICKIGTGENSGYLMFCDLSVLVFHKAGADGLVRILPVVLEISPAANLHGVAVSLFTVQERSGVHLRASSEHRNVDPSPLLNQIRAEAEAWGKWVMRAPPLAPFPVAKSGSTAWPAFFARKPDVDTRRLTEFRKDTIEILQSALCWSAGAIQGVQVSAWSAMPIQGGLIPLKISLNWHFAGGDPGGSKEFLNGHLHALLFAGNLGWSMDDFVAMALVHGAPGEMFAAPVELFTKMIRSPSSAHNSIVLMQKYQRPPGLPDGAGLVTE